jgi:hypothetical protein
MNSQLENLKKGDYIAFGFSYRGGKHTTIIVDNISSISKEKVLVHFLYGHHSLAEYIDKKDIIAIGNVNGESKIKGWSGKFDLLLPNHPLLKL